MKRLLAGSALALILLTGGPALAQTTVNNGDTSGSTSGANSGSVSSVENGGSSANNGGVTVGSQTTGASTSTSNSGSTSVSGSKSEATGGNSQSGAATAGNTQGMTVNNVTPANQTIRTAPQVYAPALTTTLTDTCMGSTSLGVSAVGGGVTLGTSWTDPGCTRRLNAREVANLTGDREAARAILCQDKNVAEAFMEVGRPCPGAAGYAQQGPMSYEPPPPPPAPPAPPVIINNNIPQEQPPAGFQMAPIPNPQELAPSPPSHHHYHHPKALLCPTPEQQCPKPH